MRDQIKQHEFGLTLERSNDYGTENVIVRVVQRDDSGYGVESPSYCGYSKWSENVDEYYHDTILYGLQIKSFVSNRDEYRLIGLWPEYQGSGYSTFSLTDVEKMHKTLRLVQKRLDKDRSIEPGDILMSLMNALRLTFVAVKRKTTTNDEYYSFYSQVDAKNEYRRMIAQAQHDARKAAEAKATEVAKFEAA